MRKERRLFLGSFFASGSGGEGICGLKTQTHVAAGLQDFALGTGLALPLEMRIHSPSQTKKMMCCLTSIHTYFSSSDEGFIGKSSGSHLATTVAEPTCGHIQAGWLREGHTLSMSLRAGP